MGHVIQTVFTEYTTEVNITSTTSGSPTSCGAALSITPHRASSKIFGQFDTHLRLTVDGSATDGGIGVKIYDGSSYIYVDGTDAHMGLYGAMPNNSGDQPESRGRHAVKFFIDATNVSTRTYTVYAWKYPSSNSPVAYAQINSSKTHLVLQEIAQ